MPEITKPEENKVEPIKFSGAKDAVSITCVKNVSLLTIVRGDPKLMNDDKVKRGGRVERGQKIVVPKKVAERLLKQGYCK